MTSRIARAKAWYLPLCYALFPGEQSGTLDHIFVEIETSDGLVGWGEAFGYRAAPMTWAALHRAVLPSIIGEPDGDIDGIRLRLDHDFHQAGRGGSVAYAMAGVDIALWDISAKRAGKPLHALLGERVRQSLPAYASLLRYGNSGGVRAGIADALSKGYHAIKLHETDFSVISSAREAVPGDLPLMVDVNCAWTPEEAQSMAERLAPLRLEWLEEPIFPPEDIEALARLRNRSGMPMAAGENLGTVSDFVRAVAMPAVDVIQPSVTKIGGLTPMLEAIRVADRCGVRVAPHSPYFGPGYWATAHLLATRDTGMLEVYYVAELHGNPYGDRVWPVNGALVLPDGPGLGVEPDRGLLQDAAVTPDG